MILDLERVAPLLQCKLEMIFPPGFFLPMQHLISHLPREARLGGPVQARWCYQGLLIKKHYLGLVVHKGKEEPTFYGPHFSSVEANGTTLA